jgi:trans-aconitate methyltransferase
MKNTAFFDLHQQIPRQGPGCPEDVRWVADQIGLAADARVCDAGCGPGADTETFLALLPEGRVTALDAHGIFIDELLARLGPDDRLTAFAGDMAKLKGPFDLIWCAGAVYFLGITKALTVWRPALAKGGHLAFSEPCFFTETPSELARNYWGGYAAGTEAEIRAEVEDAGYAVLGTRPVPDVAWEAYHRPLAARVAALRAGADAELTQVLDEAAREIADWQKVKAETGYLLVLARPN